VTPAAADVQASFCWSLGQTWRLLGVDTVMLAPGSRSTPLALALLQLGWRTEVFLDERSAAFAALGYGVATGRPAVALCTSGTAAAHFHAAVVEADLSGVPMIVVTADRPPELRDVGAPQTIDQTRLFGSVVRWFHDPGVADWSTRGSWGSLAAHAVSSAKGLDPGPVHLNLPFREPLVGKPDVVADRHLATDHGRPCLDDGQLADLDESLVGLGVVIAGRGCGAPREVSALGARLGWPVFADARSGVDGVRHFDSLLRSAFAADSAPSVALRLGEPPASKVLSQWVTARCSEQIHVSARPGFFDPDHRVIRHVVADPDALLPRLAVGRTVDDAWRSGWQRADDLAAAAIDERLDGAFPSGPAVARTLAKTLGVDSRIVVSSSMPVRDLEWFGGSLSSAVISNRGANGIDGVIATAIGAAVSDGRPTVALVGDVAFAHDVSSLVGLAARDVDVRVVVVDNDGGGIFHYLPQAAMLETATFERLFGTPHGTDAAAVAAGFGLRARRVGTRDEFVDAVTAPGPSVTVVATDRRTDVELHTELHRIVAESMSGR